MIFAFWLLSLSLTLTPGADWAYTISAGLRQSVWAALSGMLLGYLLVIFVVMAGVGSLVASHPLMLNLLTIAGVVYLFWLGFQVLRSSATIQVGQEVRQPWHTCCRKGIAVSGLNPKVLLMFVALIPQFISAGAVWSVPTQIGVLGLVHIANCALIYPIVGFGTGLMLRDRPQLARLISRLSGIAMILVGGVVLIEWWLA